MKWILLCVVLLGSLLTQQLAIPSRVPGAKFNSPANPIQIEVYLDFQCPYCKQVWPVVNQLIDEMKNDVYVLIHEYPLWLHHQAWTLSKTSGLVRVHKGETVWRNFASEIFNHQEEYFNAVWLHKTRAELYEKLADVVAKFGIDKATYYRDMNNTVAYQVAGENIHYGIGHQVMGTPVFFINGFKADGVDENTTFEQWKTLIQKLLHK